MKIVLFGATGMVGSRIAAEAEDRGHEVLAVSRSGKSPVDSPRVRAAEADATDSARVAELVRGADVVVSALAPPRDGSDPQDRFAALYTAFLAGIRQAGVRRVLVVGGAGSLRVGDSALLDTPGFPEQYKAEATAQGHLLNRLREVTDLDWTYLSPAAVIAPGERTGTFRLGGDQLLTDERGASEISAEDYAIALVDEAERGAHKQARISVAY
ncbi:putative NADH-flavin reductase [Crossiella equi]|uniref:NADH-flavin reductase n=1 Tax=Crossiella equi TaxID=130796 RepID=A0ABS5A5V5_9PSEU|nr:NAD(P)H-binding protein [Crossiella equi]MBP2471982.1 putative NADH-flavin reductase [Crossiella equi]